MSARRAAKAEPAVPGAFGLLDWRDSHHWARAAAPCRYCGDPTHLRETPMKPAHKTCAEQAYAQRAAATAADYQEGTF